ncbi:MAG: hypothetical protein K6E98_13190 [Lachnospiraceae bacterium]|nr:hypothetical protein [Lachnospiraceae bacterium]
MDNNVKSLKQTERRDDFIIKDRKSGASYYGGDQNWYRSNTMAYAGCGSVAAANMLRALLRKNPQILKKDNVGEGIKAIVSEECYKDDFAEFMGSIYKSMFIFEFPVIRRIYDHGKRGKKPLKILPPSFGMSINGFIRGTLKYSLKQGISLHAHSLPTAFCGYEKGLEFIKEGLRESGSVVLLTSLNRHPLKLYYGKSGELEKGNNSKKGIRSHFMTITGIVEEDEGDILIKFTTWGRVATVSYNELNRSWQSIKAYTSCLYYFTPAESEAVVRADMRKSFGVLCKAVFKGLFGWAMR